MLTSSHDRFIEICSNKVQFELLKQYIVIKDYVSLNAYMQSFPIEYHYWLESEVRRYLFPREDLRPLSPTTLSRSLSAPVPSSSSNQKFSGTSLSYASTSFTPLLSQPSGTLISEIPLTVKRKKKVTTKLAPISTDATDTSRELISSTDTIERTDTKPNTKTEKTSPISPAFKFQGDYSVGAVPNTDHNNDLPETNAFSDTSAYVSDETTSAALLPPKPARRSGTHSSVDIIRRAAELYCELVFAQAVCLEQAVSLLVLLSAYQDEKLSDSRHDIPTSSTSSRLIPSNIEFLALVANLFDKLFPVVCRLGHTFARGFGTAKAFMTVNSQQCEELLNIADDAECHSQFATMAIGSPDIFVRPPRFDADSQLAHEREKYFDEFSNVFRSFQNLLQQHQAQHQPQVGSHFDGLLSRFWQNTGFLMLRKVTSMQSASLPWFPDLFVKMLLFYCSKDDSGPLAFTTVAPTLVTAVAISDTSSSSFQQQQQQLQSQSYPSLSSTPTTSQSFQSLYDSSPVTPVRSTHLMSTMAGDSQSQQGVLPSASTGFGSSNNSSASHTPLSMSHNGRLPLARVGHISVAVDAEKARKLEQRMSAFTSGASAQQTPFKLDTSANTNGNSTVNLNTRGIASMETKAATTRQTKKQQLLLSTVATTSHATASSQPQGYSLPSTSSAVKESGYNALSRLFPGHQEFFVQYVLLVDSVAFRQLLVDSVTSEILELSKAAMNDTSNNSGGAGGSTQLALPFATQVVQLKLLGKFLGFLESRGSTSNLTVLQSTGNINGRRSNYGNGKSNMSSPNKSNTDQALGSNEGRSSLNRFNALTKSFPTQKLLLQAWTSGNLCLTVPWIIEFLSFSFYYALISGDSRNSSGALSASMVAYGDTICTLYEIQQSSHLRLNSSTITNNLLFVIWEIQSFERLLTSTGIVFGGMQQASVHSLPSIPSRSEDRHTCVDDGDEAFSYKFISSVSPPLKVLADSFKRVDQISSQTMISVTKPGHSSYTPQYSLSNSQSYHSVVDEPVRAATAGGNVKTALFTTPVKDKRASIKSPLQRNQSELISSNQASTRRGASASASPRPVTLFSQSKSKKLKAIQSSLQGCFWQQHPQLQQISVFLLDHIQQACSQRLKDKIASSVRELWSFVANLNRQSRTRTYVESLLQQSKGTIELILSQAVNSKESGDGSDTTAILLTSAESIPSLEVVLRDPAHSFAAKRVRYDKFDDELQQQADLIEKELVRESRVFLSEFIDTYLNNTLVELCSLSPSHPMVVDLTIHLIKQQAVSQHQSLLDFIANYGRRKLQEVCTLSCKQFAKSLRIHPEDNSSSTTSHPASLDEDAITIDATTTDADVISDIPPSSEVVPASEEGASKLQPNVAADELSIQSLRAKYTDALNQSTFSISKLAKHIKSEVTPLDGWAKKWVSDLVPQADWHFNAKSRNEWAIVFGYVTDALRKSMKVLSTAHHLLLCHDSTAAVATTRSILHTNCKHLIVCIIDQFSRGSYQTASDREAVSADYVLSTQFITTSLPICMLMDYTLRLSSVDSNVSAGSQEYANCELEMMTSHILIYLFQSNIFPVSTLVKILISTGRKSTFLYYGACFQIPEFSSDGGRTMFRAIEVFLRSIQVIMAPTDGLTEDTSTTGSHPPRASPWFRDETVLARIDDMFSTDLRSLIVSLNQ